MTYDVAKLDEIVLALFHLNAFSDRGITRAWTLRCGRVPCARSRPA
jgi:hypothetical protein